ncbi:MAG: hypothetical protein OXH85_12190 [Truepera sp.]|nr:hypothetical protein [Truepera sp.]
MRYLPGGCGRARVGGSRGGSGLCGAEWSRSTQEFFETVTVGSPGMVLKGLIEEGEAGEMAWELAYGLASA